MLFHQKSIEKVLLFFFLLFSTSTAFSQFKNNTNPLVEHLNGLDLFPVYKASQKNSFIDSIIYNGPFITFCVHFEKPTSDGHYLLEAVNSDQGWTCETARGLSHPILIKNIRKDGVLVSDYLKLTPLDLIFRNKENSKTKISCEFQFWRKDFEHGEAKLSESLIREYNSTESTFVEFKGIKTRTKSYPKVLQKEYQEDYSWARNNLLHKIGITLNGLPQETPITIFTEAPASETMPLAYTYKVQKVAQHQLFLQKVWHTENSTVFRVQYYVPVSIYTSLKLYNKGGNKYSIKSGSQKFKMQSIKNICLNQLLLHKELKDKDILKLEKAPSLYLLTYDVYFDRLPDDLNNFDLIEGKNLDSRVMPFDFYAISLK